MALKGVNMINYDKILNQLEIDIICNEEITQSANLTPDTAKNSRKLGKSIEKNVIKLVGNEEGIKKYMLLFQSENIACQWNVALNLFPLFPKKCLETLIKCKNNCSDSLKKSSMNDVITNYQKGLNSNNISVLRLKKLYRTENLNLLSRE